MDYDLIDKLLYGEEALDEKLSVIDQIRDEETLSEVACHYDWDYPIPWYRTKVRFWSVLFIDYLLYCGIEYQ